MMRPLAGGVPQRRALASFVAAIALCAGISGCLGTTPTSTFYTLSVPVPPAAPRSGQPTSDGPASEVAVWVGPVSVPRYLDRPQIVTRESGSELGVAQLHRWAGSLASDVVRVIALDLSARLGTDRVVAYPNLPSFPIDYRVTVDVARLEGTLAGEVVLDASFAIAPGSGGDAIRVGRTRVSEPVDGDTYIALVDAHGRAVARLAEQIAAALDTARGTLPTS
jgi:uncharacterized lipoprotein YmbA